MWLASTVLALGSVQSDLPRVPLVTDGQVVTSSCVVVLPVEPLVDVDGDGVLHIRAKGDEPLVVEFEGHLRGASAGVDPDGYTGLGIRVTGDQVTLVSPRVSGFKVGIEALETRGLTVTGADVSDNYRQRLGSTWEAEDASDWLHPHHNDDGEWKRDHGAGLVVERSENATITGLRARDVQNGILLDRVTGSTISRCDASWLSGWGLALWRSSGNRIESNRFEFCVRGYSHGRYNRGQDSAGLLMFEQCSNNTIRRNSITHSGDGVFGFAGLEALGQENFDRATYGPRRGCNDNLFEWNVLADAVAHGLEMTFSFGNRIVHNVIDGNAICGLWLGYGRETEVHRNLLSNNGDAGYGVERGAINAEHARELSILDNRFVTNALGVRIWTDEDAHFRETPWALENGMGARDNHIGLAEWVGDAPKVELVEAANTTVVLPAGDPGLVADASSLADPETHLSHEQATALRQLGYDTTPPAPASRRWLQDWVDRGFHGLEDSDWLLDEPRRSMARDTGRAAIVMTEWGPYDWSAPYVQPLESTGSLHRYRLLGPNSLTDVIHVSGDVDVTHDKALPGFPVGPDGLAKGVVRVRPQRASGFTPYRLIVRARGSDLPVDGAFLGLTWEVCWFESQVDPREDRKAWLEQGVPNSVSTTLDDLRLDYGMGGPAEIARARGSSELALEANHLGPDHFGTSARTSVSLPAGTWRLRSRSDDGIRVAVDGEVLIEDWTWHASREHVVTFETESERTVEIAVEHFELDGSAVLDVWLEPGP